MVHKRCSLMSMAAPYLIHSLSLVLLVLTYHWNIRNIQSLWLFVVLILSAYSLCQQGLIYSTVVCASCFEYIAHRFDLLRLGWLWFTVLSHSCFSIFVLLPILPLFWIHIKFMRVWRICICLPSLSSMTVTPLWWGLVLSWYPMLLLLPLCQKTSCTSLLQMLIIQGLQYLDFIKLFRAT